MKWIFASTFCSFVFLGIAYGTVSGQTDNGDTWQEEWQIIPGFSITRDSEGFTQPSSITFVPNPGNSPKDPLYFVTELSGKIKVVTNDRTIITFSEDIYKTKIDGNDESQDGLVGLCLEPVNGYVFAAYTFRNQDNELHNNIVRFQSTPITFSGEPKSFIFLTDIFEDHQTQSSHIIGRCQIEMGSLYVSVGDGFNFRNAQDLDSPLGKILRMDLNGQPIENNPFYENSDTKNPRNYIWAYGLRNPFGLKIQDGRLFVADNGVSIDRFLEVEKGENYLWDGSDRSIGARAAIFFFPSIAPTQLDYLPAFPSIFPIEYQNSFYLGSSSASAKGIIHIPFTVTGSYEYNVPRSFIEYRGITNTLFDGMVAALAVNTDGLYFAPLTTAESKGSVPVYKVTYDPSRAHPFTIAEELDVSLLMQKGGCLGCHTLNNKGGDIGPSLDYVDLFPRLAERLNSNAYRTLLDEVDRLNVEPYISYTEARMEVRVAEDIEQARLWVEYHLLEPKFDNPEARMPNLGLSTEQAITLANFLLTPPSPPDDIEKSPLDLATEFTRAYFPDLRWRYYHLIIAFVIGGFSSLLGINKYNKWAAGRKNKLK